MKHSASRDLYVYWNSLRGSRTAPERSAIDPAAIRDILASTFILEVKTGGTTLRSKSSFRLSGTRLDAVFQHGLKGHGFGEIWSHRDQDTVEAILAHVLDGRHVVVAAVRGAPRDYEAAEFEMVLLPLRHHGTTHTRILGSLSCSAAPSWMGLRPVMDLEVVSFRTILDHPAAIEPAGSRTPARGPAVAAPLPLPVSAGRAWPFRVYQGGRDRLVTTEGS